MTMHKILWFCMKHLVHLFQKLHRDWKEKSLSWNDYCTFATKCHYSKGIFAGKQDLRPFYSIGFPRVLFHEAMLLDLKIRKIFWIEIPHNPVNVCITAHSIAKTKKPNMAAQVVVMGRWPHDVLLVRDSILVSNRRKKGYVSRNLLHFRHTH